MKPSCLLPCLFLLLACDASPLPTAAPEELTLPAPSASANPEILEIPDAAPVVEDFSVLVGAFESKFQNNNSRGKNIQQAISFIQGVRLGPGEEFSFNATVGPRTAERGFFFAPVIVNGEMDTGLGGGVCQVSSTIHAAALMANMEVVSRTPHSRPSSYMPLGLDATVGFPEDCHGDPRGKGCYAPDLRFRNPFKFPVQIKATILPTLDKWGFATLRVEIFGAEASPNPVYTYGYLKTGETFERRVKKVTGKPAGYKKRVQKGADAMVVTGTLTTTLPDGTKTTKVVRSKYPPTDEVWEVGDDYPEGAPPPWEVADAGADAGVVRDAATD